MHSQCRVTHSRRCASDLRLAFLLIASDRASSKACSKGRLVQRHQWRARYAWLNNIFRNGQAHVLRIGRAPMRINLNLVAQSICELPGLAR
jgi:hypothetical protein